MSIFENSVMIKARRSPFNFFITTLMGVLTGLFLVLGLMFHPYFFLGVIGASVGFSVGASVGSAV